MQLRTYTGLWKVEKRLYKFYDINLPYPVSLKQLGLFLASSLPWVGLLQLIGIPFATPWHLLYLAPPAAATYYGNRPVAEGKTLVDYLTSQIKFLFAPRLLTRLRPAPEQTTQPLRAVAWRRIS